MCESRAVPSGKVYRQLFDAQVQLSRSLLAGRRDTRTDCLSAEDSNTHCSTTSRLLCPLSLRGQLKDDDDVDDVSRLPDCVVSVVHPQRSDIIQHLEEKKRQKHEEALKQLETELTQLAQVCESQVRTISLELLSSLQDGDLRLDTLKDRMEHLEHVSEQEVCVLWEEVQEELQLKEIRILELNHKLTECETQRTHEIRAVFRKNLHMLENISFLSPPDVYRLIHTEATMLNQCLLANRRSAARLLLLLQEENLQQESLLRLHWEDQLGRWRRSRVSQILDRFRSFCSSEEQRVPVPVSGQPVQETTGDLTERRDDIISQICSLVPPSCSTALVSDWFNQLTAVNQLIDGRHGDLLHQLRCCYEQMWQNRLAEVERCEEELSALQLSEDEVNDIVSSQLLSLIGRSQRQDEDRLAAVDLCWDSAARRAVSLSRCVFVVMRGAALLWETHRRRLERREEELQQHLDDLRRSQQQLIQRKTERLDELLGGLRQESSEDALKTSLDKTVHYLQDVKHSCSQCVCDQWEVLDLLPSLLLEELLSYSSSLCSFYHLSPAYTPSPEELQKFIPSYPGPGQNLLSPSPRQGPNLLPSSPRQGPNLLPSSPRPGRNLLPSSPRPGRNLLSSSPRPGRNLLPSSPRQGRNLLPSSPRPGRNLLPGPVQSEPVEGAELQKPKEVTENHPISCQDDPDSAQPSQDWLAEVESSLLELCDISSDVTLTSSRGVVYRGPAFRCPAPDLQQETHLSLFPVELLTHSLSRMRTLVLDDLEQRFHDVLGSAVAMVTDRKEAVRLEQELQLQQLNPKHILTHKYQPRLAELQLHRQQVEVHCEEALDVLTSCRVELQELQTSIRRKNQEFTVRLSNMEDDVLTADSSQRLEAVSSTLQDCLDQHIKDTQRCQTSFRKTVHTRLEEVRTRTAHLLLSFRLFSEGGDFAPQEVKEFQRRLKEETRQISVTEQSVFSELEVFESRSLQQVKEAAAHLEEKLSFLKSEVEFNEKIQKIISSTRVQIKAEAASSNQQQSSISSRLEDLRRTMEDTQALTVSPDQVCSFLSSVNEELRKRCQYLDFSLESLSAGPESRKPVRSAPPLGLLQTSRTGVDLLDDPAVCIIKSLNRFCVIRDVGAEASERDERGRTAAGQNPVQRLQQKCSESVSTLSVRRGCRSIRTERRFQVFGPEPEQKPHSFSSTLTSLFWRTNDVLLLVAEVFYQSERCGLSGFFLVPDSLDQWAESMQQRLLGYQEETRKFLSTSRAEMVRQLSVCLSLPVCLSEMVRQLSVLEELLHSLPSVLIRNHGQRQEAGLREEVGRVRLKLEETLAASEEDKRVNVRQLRASLRDEELQALTSREEFRQQQLHDAVCCAHLELQVCVSVWGEEFVTSLASLTEQLLYQLDELLTPEETEVCTVTMETGAETGQKQSTVGRTWSGIPYLSPSTNSTAAPSNVTMVTTASITTTRCTLGHLAVIEQRDAAVKRLEQLLRSETSHLDDDKRRRLSELQSWNTHWRQQIHTVTRTDTHSDT